MCQVVGLFVSVGVLLRYDVVIVIVFFRCEKFLLCMAQCC